MWRRGKSGNCLIRRAGYPSPAPMLYLEEDQNSTGMKKKHFKLSPPTAPAAQILLKSVFVFLFLFLNYFALAKPKVLYCALEPFILYISHFTLFFAAFYVLTTLLIKVGFLSHMDWYIETQIFMMDRGYWKRSCNIKPFCFLLLLQQGSFLDAKAFFRI